MSEDNAQAAPESAEAAEGATSMAADEASNAEGATASTAVDAPVIDDTPTPEQARVLFAERRDASGCLTTEGWMRRDGTFV